MNKIIVPHIYIYIGSAITHANTQATTKKNYIKKDIIILQAENYKKGEEIEKKKKNIFSLSLSLSLCFALARSFVFCVSRFSFTNPSQFNATKL